MNELHKLMDEKVDYYKNNDTWRDLLHQYNQTKDSRILTQMWPIMFQCASNILKKRFGRYWLADQIADKAIDMCEVVMNRITNKTNRYPQGYDAYCLPLVMKYALLSVVYSPKAVQDDKEASHLSYEELTSYSFSYETEFEAEETL